MFYSNYTIYFFFKTTVGILKIKTLRVIRYFYEVNVL